MKTIDIHAKEWFDKANGNSYFAATIIIDFGLSSEKTVKVDFTYGYGDYYLSASFNKLNELELLPNSHGYGSLWRYCNDKGIALRYSKQEKCLKRELKNI